MEPRALLRHLAEQGDLVADAARRAERRAELGERVVACPGFDVADLLWHLTVVYRFWGEVVVGQLTSPEQVPPPERPPDVALGTSCNRAFARLVSILSGADPATGVWTPAVPHTVAFVIRRVTHETTVHRGDLDIAVDGAPRVVDPDLAADGVDEWVTVMLQSRPDAGLEIVADDVGRSWWVGAERAPPRAVMRGSASDLLFAVWRRTPIERVQIEGDRPFAVGVLDHAELLG